MSDLFKYTTEQSENIRRKIHPDCCQAQVCSFCGASEDNLKPCAGDLTGLALELFEEANCSQHNANIKSIGQIINWSMHDRHARAFDAAARALATLQSTGGEG